ncbi:hypothetical protein Hanom_Chr11g00969141 [Helianthus anomalus]
MRLGSGRGRCASPTPCVFDNIGFYIVHTASCWTRNCNLIGFTSDVHGGSKFGLHLFGIVTRVAFIWVPWCNAPQMSWAYVDWLRVCYIPGPGMDVMQVVWAR